MGGLDYRNKLKIIICLFFIRLVYKIITIFATYEI